MRGGTAVEPPGTSFNNVRRVQDSKFPRRSRRSTTTKHPAQHVPLTPQHPPQIQRQQQALQAGPHQHVICSLHRHVGAAAHRNANICLGQRHCGVRGGVGELLRSTMGGVCTVAAAAAAVAAVAAAAAATPPPQPPAPVPESLIPSPTMATPRCPPACSCLMRSALPAGSSCERGQRRQQGGGGACTPTCAQTLGKLCAARAGSSPCYDSQPHLCAHVGDAHAGGDGTCGGPAVPGNHVAGQTLAPGAERHGVRCKPVGMEICND